MDRDLQDYYESLLDMFISPGWKNFIKDQEEALEYLTLSAPRNCPDNDLWQQCRGKLEILSIIVGFEETMRSNLAELEKEGDIEAQYEYEEMYH